jgi:hypothetical protein
VEHSGSGAGDAIRSPLGIAVLMIVSTFGGGLLKDRLSTESRDVGSAARIDALDKRLDQMTIVQSDYQHNGLTANQFNEFRLANDKRLDDIRTDLQNLTAEINSAEHLRYMNRK